MPAIVQDTAKQVLQNNPLRFYIHLMLLHAQADKHPDYIKQNHLFTEHADYL
jgi:hypothetical protein